MILLGMAYATLVGALIALAAAAAERGAQLLRLPARWIWIAAMAGTLAFAARVAIAGNAARVEFPARVPAAVAAHAIIAAQPAWMLMIDRVRDALSDRLDVARWLYAGGSHALGGRADLLAALVWSGATLLLLGLFGAVHRRMTRARSRWPKAELHGVPVRVSTDAGPAVIGVRRAEVVVPQWLFARGHDEQRMVVAHEAEHVRARDPLLLAVAWGATIAAPWNAALWFMMSRLRLAVELDCDARVLRGGAAPRAYGSLLIDVAQHASLTRHAALALSGRSSHLRRRIVAMQTRTPRFAAARAGLIGTLSLAALVAACEARIPTASEVDTMTASSAEQTGRQLAVLRSSDTDIVYRVNGREVSAKEARALPGQVLGSIGLTRRGDGRAVLSIRTKLGSADSVIVDFAARDSAAARLERRRAADPIGAMTQPSARPANEHLAYYIDGKRVDASALRTIDPKSIQSVEVLKGDAARAMYDLPDATGVIVVKTKSGAGGDERR